MPKRLKLKDLFVFAAAALLAGCSAAHYQRAADKEVYGILREKQKTVNGKTNEFTIDTPYSKRDPNSIQSPEIIQQRLESPKMKLTLDQALKSAVENSRTFQLNKENLYFAALTLTGDRYIFKPHFTGSSQEGRSRLSTGEHTGGATNQFGMKEFFTSGASLSASILNGMLQYFTGNPRYAASTMVSADITQPLLRGAGAEIVGENLKQSERNVIYEIRTFERFQNTFAVSIVGSYYRLLQQKDTVRNEFSNYKKLVSSREEAEAKSVDRFSALQVDQAHQAELSAKTRYITAVQTYQTQIDAFKTTLGIPLGTDLALDDGALVELSKTGLIPVSIDESGGYSTAIQSRLDIINEIDRFEDSRRKIKVAANQLKADVNLLANYQLPTRGQDDYTKFSFSQYQAAAGIQINLPIDRLTQRNAYRTVLINFEREIRTLAITLDDLRNSIRADMRTLELSRQNYQIQKNAVELADRQVEGTTLQIQAGRPEVQIRDLLDAQSAQLAARNTLTSTLVDYHLARLNLLLDLGKLDTSADRFWLRETSLSGKSKGTQPKSPDADEPVVPPDKLFDK